MVEQKAKAPVLLVLDAGAWQTSWAVFWGEEVAATGLVGATQRNDGISREVRLALQLGGLDEVSDRWRPQEVALSQPSGIRWPMPALDAALDALQGWVRRRGLPLHCYTDQEVRRAVVGSERATGSQVAFGIMALLGAVGQGRTTREWEAIAAGYYHLARQG